MAESLSVNNLTRQIAREQILNNQRRESFKSYIVCYLSTGYTEICNYILEKLVERSNMYITIDIM